MSSTSIIKIPGLDVKVNLRYPDKVQYFQQINASNFQCLESGTHTDMVLVYPLEKELVRVSCSIVVLFLFIKEMFLLLSGPQSPPVAAVPSAGERCPGCGPRGAGHSPPGGLHGSGVGLPPRHL